MRIALLLIVLFPAASVAAPEGCRAWSGSTLRPLVELFTSEGCSSCPPADRWLSRRFAHGRSHQAVPIAFHVDYWDGLGWKDRFASPAFTTRQQQAMRANHASFVYTPQLVLQGRDFGDWRGSSAEAMLAAAAAATPKAWIDIVATPRADAVDATVRVSLAATPERALDVALAYVDSGLASDVKAGENRGERLVHDHVVRALVTRRLAVASASFDLRLPRPVESGTHASLVAFVQDAASGDVLQALPLSLEGCS